MALFIKQGINKASGKYIYPELVQGNTGNCAAYSGASCLYAYGLDHEAGLIPTVSGGTPEAEFQAKTARMVERLTRLCYQESSSVADGYRKYLKEKKLDDKFTVTEATGGSYTLPDGTTRSNWEFMKDELRRCQDVLVHIKWPKGTCSKDARHSICLTGFDDAAKDLLAMNPWANPSGGINVPPDKAGANTAAGKADAAHTKYKVTMDGDTVKLAYEGRTATIYGYVKICPATKDAAAVDGTASQSPGATPGARPTARFDYALHNDSLHGANVLGIGFAGFAVEDIAGIFAPPGWSGTPWYRSHTPDFALPAPEQLESGERDTDLMGVLFTAREPLATGQGLEGFGFELYEPRTDYERLAALVEETLGGDPGDLLARASKLLGLRHKWIGGEGSAVVAARYEGGTHAVHCGTIVPELQCTAGDRIDAFLREQGFD